MRKLQIFIIISLIFFLLACQKKEESNVYSCDDTVNSWVIERKTEISSMNRDDILSFEDEYQRAVFRAFTPLQRFDCWNSKLNEVLALTWDSNEESHIKDLLNKIEISWFNDNYYSDSLIHQNQRDYYIKSWIEKGLFDIGWSKEMVYSIVGTLETNVSGNGYLIEADLSFRNNDSGKEAGQKTCACSTESDWCNLGGNSLGGCVSGNCETTAAGCGTLWIYSCNGLCRLGIIID